MQQQYLYSVIIPTYNREKLVQEAINSVLAQANGKVQIIVIDDGSTDNTATQMRQYGNEIDYIYQVNQGVCVARNSGLNVATGQYICFLDSDDIWLPDKMACEQAIFEQDPQIDMVISDAESWCNEQLITKSRIASTLARISQIISIPPPPSAFLLPRSCPVWIEGGLSFSCCMTFSRAALDRLDTPLFDTSFDNFEDWDFQIRLLCSCKTFIMPKLTTVVRRFNDGTRIRRAVPNMQESPEQIHERLVCCHRVLKKALHLTDWSNEILTQLKTAIIELEQKTVNCA